MVVTPASVVRRLAKSTSFSWLLSGSKGLQSQHYSLSTDMLTLAAGIY